MSQVVGSVEEGSAAQAPILGPQSLTEHHARVSPVRLWGDPNEAESIGDYVRPRLRLKHDQPTGKLTRGVVSQLLTPKPSHPHGI
ncbi:DUF2196 domain-containing protein [Deinococcus antarcticus]|uniref:DUF2196 domain-containing protein n=1 Tax=Deinococcus antarcticus TaxID=1298767 RepID=A0ABV8ACF0_9DEIO